MSEQSKLSSAQRAWDNMEPDYSFMGAEHEVQETEWEKEYRFQFSKLSREEQKLVEAQPGSLIALRLKWKVEDIIYKRRQWEEEEEARKWAEDIHRTKTFYPNGRWNSL